MKKLMPLMIISLLLLAACGATPAPTMNPVDVQNTAVAAAWTVVAMTNASVPTLEPPTPLPSPTLQPTFTLMPSPTTDLFAQSNLLAPPTATFASQGNAGATLDPCNAPMSKDPAGPKVKTNIDNRSGGSLVLSLYLQLTPFGECGIYSVNVDVNKSASILLVEGCYWGGAFVTGKNDTKAFGTNFCLKGASGRIVVTKDTIKAQ